VGATLVAQAIQHWSSHLSDRAFRVLITMAVTAKDNASKEVPAGLYFGGHEALTVALRRERSSDVASAKKTVKRAIEELTAVGAIRCTQAAVLGSNAVYQLTLNNQVGIYERERQPSTLFANGGDSSCPPGGDSDCPPGGTVQDPPVGTADVPPRGTRGVPPSKEPLEEPLEEPSEELEEEERVALTADVAVTREAAGVEKPETISSACRDPTCEMGFLYDPTKPKGHRNIPCPECRPSNVIPFQRRGIA
jgi:hypothetical protein